MCHRAPLVPRFMTSPSETRSLEWRRKKKRLSVSSSTGGGLLTETKTGRTQTAIRAATKAAINTLISYADSGYFSRGWNVPMNVFLAAAGFVVAQLLQQSTAAGLSAGFSSQAAEQTWHIIGLLPLLQEMIIWLLVLQGRGTMLRLGKGGGFLYFHSNRERIVSAPLSGSCLFSLAVEKHKVPSPNAASQGSVAWSW